MKLKNLLIGAVSLLLLGSVYAILQPNIASRGSAITSIDPSTYYLMVQSGTSQSHITVDNFANSISGYYLTTGTMPALDYLPLSGNTSGTAMSGDIWMDTTHNIYFGTSDILIDWYQNGVEMYSKLGGEISYMAVTDAWGALMPTFSYSSGVSSRDVVLSSGGLQYQDDYSGTYTDRSLIDKGFLGSKFANLTTTYIPFWSGTEFYNTNMVYSGAKLGIGTTTPGYTLTISGDMMITQGAAQAGGFLLDVLGKRVGLYGGIVGITTGASVYGQTDVGVAGYFESLGAGTGLVVTSSTGVGATIQGVTTGLITYGRISAMSGIYDSAGVSFITGGALAGYLTIANSGTYFEANSGTYFNNNITAYKPYTGVITYPGTDNYCPTTKAVVDYISGFTTLESVITTGAYILSGNTPVIACTSGNRQIAMTGGQLYAQRCSGTTWVDVGGWTHP